MRKVAETQGIDVAKDGVEKGIYGEDREKMLQELVHMKSLQTKDEIQSKIDNRYSILEDFRTGKENPYNLSPKAQAVIDNDPILSEGLVKATASKSGYNPTGNEDMVASVQRASQSKSGDSLSA